MLASGTFQGRIAVITGGGTGLGRAMALELARLGADVVVTSRNLEHLEPVAAEVRALGRKALAVVCDVRDPAQVQSAVAATKSAFGQVDVLVNNAAGNFVCPTERLSPNAFASVVGIVLNGSFHCTLACGRRWIEAKQPASVLNILATYVWTGSGFVVPSACAKAGVLALTRSLAAEWARYRIRLNAIAPGPFPTEGAWSRIIPAKVCRPVSTVSANASAATSTHVRGAASAAKSRTSTAAPSA